MLTSRNYQELYETLGHILDKEKRDNYIRKVISMCSDKFLISEWEMEQLDKLIESEKERILKEEVYEDAFNTGFNDGFNDGINENKKDIVIKMLNKNMDIKLIMELTNLSKEEINNIKENNTL